MKLNFQNSMLSNVLHGAGRGYGVLTRVHTKTDPANSAQAVVVARLKMAPKKGAQAETFKWLEACVRACCDRPRAVIDLAL